MMMKVWQFDSFGGPDKLVLRDTEAPKINEGMALVKVKFAGVNPIDRSIVSGRFDWVSLPHTPGAEFVGTVEEIGEGQRSDLSKGRKVAVYPNIFCGECYNCLRGQETACLENKRIDRSPYNLAIEMNGGWGEYALVPIGNLLPLPEDLSLEEACTLPVDGLTAWHMLSRAKPRPLETTLVVGSTGGIGIFAVQIAKLCGTKVVAIIGEERQAELVTSLGADVAINRNREDVVQRVKEITKGRGVDLVVDPLGAATWETSVASLAPLGRYVTCGTLTGATSQISLLRLYSMQLKIIGSTSGSRADLASVLRAAKDNRIHGVIQSKYRFDEVPSALAKLGEHGRVGKIILQVSTE